MSGANRMLVHNDYGTIGMPAGSRRDAWVHRLHESVLHLYYGTGSWKAS